MTLTNCWKLDLLKMVALSLSLTFFTYSNIAFSDVTINNDVITRDSAYPIFEEKKAVQNKIVTLKNRYLLSLAGGIRRNDAYFKSGAASLSVTYHLHEDHGIQLFGSKYFNSPSSDSQLLEQTTSVKNLDLAPHPSHALILSYKFLPFYGKLSVAKNTISHLNIFTTFGAGLVSYTGKSVPAVNIGIGNDLFLYKTWGFTMEMRAIFYNGPDPVSINLNTVTSTPPVDTFDTIRTMNLLLNFGFIKLF